MPSSARPSPCSSESHWCSWTKPLFAMDTGKIVAKTTGQNGTEDIILMIDTGSELNLISQDVQGKLNIPIDLDRQNWSLQGINSGPEPPVGCYQNVPIKIGGIRFDHHFFVKKGSFEGHNMLLGQPWLVGVGATIKYGGTEGNHGMDIQVYEKGNLSRSSVSLHALMNEE
jgi:Aspartyl protease